MIHWHQQCGPWNPQDLVCSCGGSGGTFSTLSLFSGSGGCRPLLAVCYVGIIQKSSVICSSTVPSPKKCWSGLQVQLDLHYGRRRDGDIREGDVMDILEKFPKKSKCWQLHWILLGATVWHLWREKSRRLHLKLQKPHEEISQKAIIDTQISFCWKENPPPRQWDNWMLCFKSMG